MKKYKISVESGYKDKYSGVLFSVDYQNRYNAGIAIAILKRISFYCDNKRLNLGLLFISIANFYKLFV